MYIPAPPTYERTTGDKISVGHHLRWNGEWYVVVFISMPSNMNSHKVRQAILRHEETGLDKSILIFSNRHYSFEKRSK